MSDDTVTFKSFAGLSFMLLALAAVFYILAFGGTSWGKREGGSGPQDAHLGLWQSCICLELDSDALLAETTQTGAHVEQPMIVATQANFHTGRVAAVGPFQWKIDFFVKECIDRGIVSESLSVGEFQYFVQALVNVLVMR